MNKKSNGIICSYYSVFMLLAPVVTGSELRKGILMNSKIINLSNSVYEICSANPEIIPILADLGFKDITKPGMLATAGRFMTIPKGAAMKKISMEQIMEVFEKNGFEVIKN
jgi:hypothetical protein